MRTTRIVRWHGMDEECSGSAEAIDRWDALDARGIEAAIYEVVDGERRRLSGRPLPIILPQPLRHPSSRPALRS
jgi:hypothetical protein